MRLLLPRRYAADNLQRLRIDNADRLVQLGRHIQHAAVPVVDRAVWPHSMTKINRMDDLAGWQIDHFNRRTVSPRFTYADVAIDRYKGRLPIRRNRNFMPMPVRSFSRHGR